MGVRRTGLTPRQKVFVQEYLVDLNARRAAGRAGYAAEKSGACGPRLVADPLVRKAIHKAMADRARRTQTTADRVLREYARIAFADIRRVTTSDKEHGLQLRPLAELSDDDAAAIAEVSSDGDGKKSRIKLHDKKRALDAIARHLGLFGKPKPVGESPAAAAERAREIIRERLARLARSKDEG